MSRLRVALVLAVTLAPSGALGQAPVRIVATANVAGRFGRGVCNDEASVVPHPMAGFTGALPADALLIDTGGLVTPHGVSRFAARDVPDALVELVVALGYDALALGESDLAAPRERMIRLAASLFARGVPFVASNLACEHEDPLCDAIVDASDPAPRLLHDGEDIAFLALLDPAVLRRVAPDRALNLTVSDVATALPELVRRARGQGATMVLAVLDLRQDEALALTRTLPEDGRPDVLLLSGVGEELLFARPRSVVPPIIGPPPGSGALLTWQRTASLPEVSARPLDAGVPSALLERFAGAVGPPFCAAWGRALSGGHLERPLDAAALAQLTADIMREHAGADAAFFNLGAIDESFADPSLDELSAGDLYVAIAYDEPLVVADVPSSWLREAFDRSAQHHLVTPGLSAVGEGVGGLRVRGRPVVDRAGYRVVTLRFLAEGGDDALPPLPPGSTWRTLEHLENGAVRYDSVRDVLLSALEVPSDSDPRDARLDPATTPEWIARAQLDGTFSGAVVDDPNRYGSALLSVGDSVALGAELDLRLDATAPDWTWQSRLGGRYRTQWAPGPSGAGEFVEAQDQVQLRSLGSYRGWRADPSAVYIPDAYVELFVETELTQPASRDFHWLLVRPTAGLRFPLLPEVELKLQGGLEVQPLAPGAEVDPGAGATLTLNRWNVMEGGGRSLAVEGTIDFFWADLFDTNRWQLRSRVDVALDLFGPLALTFGAQLYLEDRSGQGAAFAFSATAGFRIAGVDRVVGP